MKWNKSFFVSTVTRKTVQSKSQWFLGEIFFSSCFLASMGGISLKSTPSICFHSPIFLTLACLFVTLSLSHSHAPGRWLRVTKIFSLNCHHALRRRRRRRSWRRRRRRGMGITTKKKKVPSLCWCKYKTFYSFFFIQCVFPGKACWTAWVTAAVIYTKQISSTHCYIMKVPFHGDW